jgi:hypothetical protein
MAQVAVVGSKYLGSDAPLGEARDVVGPLELRDFFKAAKKKGEAGAALEAIVEANAAPLVGVAIVLVFRSLDFNSDYGRATAQKARQELLTAARVLGADYRNSGAS